MDKKVTNVKTQNKKMKLIRTQKESNRLKIIITVAVLLVIALTYYLIDSASYVATVDKNRISKSEYQFFLSQQKSAVELEEGISGKTEEEREAYWTKTADGQNQREKAKNDALDTSKEYLIQLIKARETGLSINSAIKSEATGILQSNKGSMTDKQFDDYIRFRFDISSDDLSKITANLILINDFKEAFINKNYTPSELTEADIRAYYEKDTKMFDNVSISYIEFSKFEDDKELTAEQLSDKMKKANEALDRAKQGEEMDKLIAEYSESKLEETTEQAEPVGKATLSYSEGTSIQNIIDWVFENKPGDAEVIETDSTIFVIKIDSRSTFDKVKATIKNYMDSEAKENFYDETLQSWGLDEKYNIVINNNWPFRVYDSIPNK